MSDPTLESLFWEEIDSPSPEGRRRLEALVDERRELESELDELRALAATLDEVSEEPAPPQLLQGVRRAIARRPVEAPRAGLRGWLRALAGAARRPRLAYATIALVVAAVAVHLITGWPSAVDGPERSRLAGALNVGAEGPLEIVIAGSGATLHLARHEGTLTARLSGSSDAPLRLTIAADAGLELARAEGTDYQVVSRAGAIEVVAAVPLALTMELEQGATTLELQAATVGGESLLARQIELAELGAG